METPHLYLASISPRRRQLLTLAGWTFDIHPVDIDETPLAGEAPREYVLRLAEAKACAAASGLRESGAAGVILASDTAVVDISLPPNGEQTQILGKPVDQEDALRMLRYLRGRVHQVFTALAALRLADGQMRTDLCETRVPMRSYSEEEIQAYVASGDPMDKAGAYAIQHAGFHPVDRVDGCYASVMGLPVCRLPHILAPLGLPIPPQQAELTIACRDGSPGSGCRVQQWLPK